MAAGVPFVIPRLLKLGLTTVLHAIPVAEKYTAYPITYFTQRPVPEHKHFCIPWGSERFSGFHPHRNGSHIGFTGKRVDIQEYDLAESLLTRQLKWLDPQTQSRLISLETENYPYEGVNGRRHPYKIENGIVQNLPNPQKAWVDIELGDLDEFFG